MGVVSKHLFFLMVVNSCAYCGYSVGSEPKLNFNCLHLCMCKTEQFTLGSIGGLRY